METASFSAYIPVSLFNPFPADHKVSIQETIDELIQTCDDQALYFDDDLQFKISIHRIEKDETPDPSIFDLHRPGFVPERQLLRLDTIFPFGDMDVTTKGIDLGKKQSESLKLTLLAGLFEKVIYDLVLMANLAHPSILEIYPGAIYNANEFIAKTNRMMSHLELMLNFARKMKWPSMNDLSLGSVMEWFCGGSYHSVCLSQTPVDRAVHAFGHLFEDEPSKFGPLHIFWAMIGIEALYCKGTTDIMGQVFVKSQLLLREHSIPKRAFSKMYDYRSRFVHGDINFPSKYLYYDESPELLSYYKKSDDAEDLAIALLVASLQELIKRGWHELTFSYVLNEPKVTNKETS